MNRSHRPFPFLSIALLLSIGIGAFIAAFRLADHRQALGGVMTLAFLGAFAVLLRWRDARRASAFTATPPPTRPQPGPAGTVYGLMPGTEYCVLRSFTDYYGNVFERGEVLRFKDRAFLPYDGGHTIFFDGRTMYLQEERNSDILDAFSTYMTETHDNAHFPSSHPPR